MLPVVALVGRPNVGKSTLFNVLTRTRDALVHDRPGVTRDRQYGICRLLEARPFVVIDTGGLGDAAAPLDAQVAAQALRAIEEADVVVLAVDARDGLLPADRAILDRLRRGGRPLLLVVNKVDGLDPDMALAEFGALGVARPLPLSAAHGRGVGELLTVLQPLLPCAEEQGEAGGDEGARVAIFGRPNVGKSTLVNRLLGEERVIASDLPGTTRDTIRIPLERDGRRYTLIDTAGVRRRARVADVVEKFSVLKALQAIESSDVCVLVLDAGEGVAEQDLSLIGQVIDAGRALVIAVNKWDGLDRYQREQCMRSLERRLEFVSWAKRVFISALHGSGLRELMRAVDRAYAAASRELGSAELTRGLAEACRASQPPLVRGHAPRLKFAHPGGVRPPTVVIHGSRTRHLAESYRRYLENFFRKRWRLEGTPIRIEFRDGENPYAGRRNQLSERQQRSRQRMIRNTRRS